MTKASKPRELKIVGLSGAYVHVHLVSSPEGVRIQGAWFTPEEAQRLRDWLTSYLVWSGHEQEKVP